MDSGLYMCDRLRLYSLSEISTACKHNTEFRVEVQKPDKTFFGDYVSQSDFLLFCYFFKTACNQHSLRIAIICWGRENSSQK